MSDKQAVAHAIEQAFGKQKGNVFIGFDGVSDELIDVVATRKGAGQYEAMTHMAQLGDKISKAAGKSCNVELMPKRRKIGGNGPILANALVEGGHDITLVGTLGEDDEIEPLFQPLTKRCKEVVTLGPSAYTQACEFSDGKIMFGKLQTFENITIDNLLAKIPPERLLKMHEELDLFVSANWTMLLGINDIWNYIRTDILPQLSSKKRYMFVDLADPAKRTDADVQAALDLLAGLSKGYDIVLGLNESEEGRIAQVLGVATEVGGPDNALKMADGIRTALGLAQVVCHTSRYAVSSHADGEASVEVPTTTHPKVMTGAGDNFNAGFCNGLLYGLDPAGALTAGVATSGFYVRHGWSPTMKELAEFLQIWHDGRLSDQPPAHA